MSSESKPVNFSGQIRIEPTIIEGKASVHVSGLSVYGPGLNLSVSGTNLNPTTTGESRTQQFITNNTITIGTINAPTSLGLNSTVTNSPITFDEVFYRLDSSPIDDKEYVRNLVIQYRDGITKNSPEQSRSFLDKMEDKIKKYPQMRELTANAGLALIAASLKLVGGS